MKSLMKKLLLLGVLLIGAFFLLIYIIEGIAIGHSITNKSTQVVPLSNPQALLPFQVCLPAYIPHGLARKELVTIEGEIESQSEVNLRIDYFRPGSEPSVMTLVEWNAPGNVGRLDPDDETERRVALRSLLAWLTDATEAEKLLEQVEAVFQVYKHADMEHLVVEIRSPESLKSVYIGWRNEPVGYHLFTRLSVEEASRVADSVTLCTLGPNATPPE